MRLVLCAVVAGLLSLQPVSGLSAQLFGSAPPPGQDHGSVRLSVGALAPLTTFTDPSFGESNFAPGAAFGFSALVWPFQGGLGIAAEIFRSRTDGENELSEFAPIAVNDPVQWIFNSGIAWRFLSLMPSGFPYVTAGVGLKQYNWETYSPHKEERDTTWNVGAGFELRPAAIGPFGLSLDVRSVHSSFIAFGIDGGNWRPGTEARPGIGFYGGEVDGVANHDLLVTFGLALPF